MILGQIVNFIEVGKNKIPHLNILKNKFQEN